MDVYGLDAIQRDHDMVSLNPDIVGVPFVRRIDYFKGRCEVHKPACAAGLVRTIVEDIGFISAGVGNRFRI
jgi:hypothetical protein